MREAAQVEELDGDLAAVGLEELLALSRGDHLGKLRREEALQAREQLQNERIDTKELKAAMDALRMRRRKEDQRNDGI